MGDDLAGLVAHHHLAVWLVRQIAGVIAFHCRGFDAIGRQSQIAELMDGCGECGRGNQQRNEKRGFHENPFQPAAGDSSTRKTEKERLVTTLGAANHLIMWIFSYGLRYAGNLQQNWEKEIRETMVRPLPSKTERLVRAFLLLVTSAVLTLVAWSLGLYRSGDSTQVAIAIFAIVIAAVLVSRFSAKRVMRLFGWGQ